MEALVFFVFVVVVVSGEEVTTYSRFTKNWFFQNYL